MTFRLVALAAFLLGSAGSASAQVERVDSTEAAVYIEFLGNGGLYSINVERYVPGPLVVRAGLARWNGEFLGGTEQIFITVPMSVSYVGGRGSSRLEIGVGLMVGSRRFVAAGERESFRNATAIVGYRYEPSDQPLLLRFGLAPFLPLAGDFPSDSILLSFGMSAGYRF